MPIQYATLSNIIVDDVVIHTGATHMATLGGAGTHAIGGMLVWSRAVGIVANVGADFAPEHRDWYTSHGVDVTGVHVHAGRKTPRAWQLFEPDERRIEIMRVLQDEWRFMLRPTLSDIPPQYFQAAGWHGSWGSMADFAAFVQHVKSLNPKALVVWEPTPPQLREAVSVIRSFIAQCDICSPNLMEATELCQSNDPQVMVDTLLDWGAPLVALRMGAEGSLVKRAGEPRTLHVPATPANVVDVTGAGNAYCGGFLVGLVETGDAYEAAARAAVSASFAIEQFGPARLPTPVSEEAARRLAWTKAHVQFSASG